MFWFSHYHCVSCFFIRWTVAETGLITRAQVLLFKQKSRLFFGIEISAGLAGAWWECVLVRPMSRTATWNCVKCNKARNRASRIRTRTNQRGGCVQVQRFREAYGFAHLFNANSILPIQRTTRELTRRVFSRNSISDPGYEVINGKTQLVVGREVEVRAHEQIGYLSSVRNLQFQFRLAKTLQFGSICAYKFDAI